MPNTGPGKKKKKSGSTSMDFSAAENFLSGMDFGINLDFNPDYSGGYFDDVGDDLNTARNSRILNEILEARRGKVSFIDPTIEDIYKRTVRVIKGKVTKEFQFVTNQGKFVKKGTAYHIHYTKDLGEHFMTGIEHNNILSKLIFPLDNVGITQFGYYSSLNKQEPLILESTVTYPTEKDYKKGSFTRYFARKANEEKSSPFEVSNADSGTSPLYIYATVNWNLKGTKAQIFFRNNKQIALAMKTIPNIYRILSPYQFYKAEESLTPMELVKERLGVVAVSETTKEVKKKIKKKSDLKKSRKSTTTKASSKTTAVY